MAKQWGKQQNNLRLFCHSFFPLMTNKTLLFSELESCSNSNSFHQI